MTNVRPISGARLEKAMFQGCGTALVTPFRPDLSLDEEGLRRLVRRQIEGGIHFLVPCGTTGENPTLSREEHLRVVEITLEEAAGKTPVLAGCGGNNTREVVELARDLEGMGADGLLVVTPYYNTPTPDGLYQHYREVARATRLPIVVYNVPGRTGTNVDPATLKRLAEIETVVGVKEASGNISQMAAIFQTVPEDFGRGKSLVDHAAPGRRRHHLGGLQRGALRHGAPGLPLPGGGLPRRTGDAAPAARPDGDQLHRVQPRSGEGGPGLDGPDRARLPPPRGAAET